MCVEFLNEHPHGPVLRGEQPDGFAFVCFPASNKGIWYKAGAEPVAMGMIQAKNLAILGDIAASKKLAR